MKGTTDPLHKREKIFGKGWCKHSKAKTCESKK
jgi:hypothetical protein